MLLAKGADANAPIYWDLIGQTPLIAAAKNGHTTVVKDLLEHGTYVNARGGFLHSTALHAAQAGKHEEVVRLLRKAGARE